MSFFSSTKDLPQPKQKPLNIDERRTSTNEQARPVPYFCGIARLAVTFISQAFGVKSKKVKMRVGKKKETVGYNYFASFAALIAHGPLDRLEAIWMDDELVWEGPLNRSGDYADITIENRGNVRLYWGTESQTQDPLLATSGTVHPAYRGQACIVFDQLVDPLSITLQKRAYRPLTPLNLRVAGDGYNPTYGTGTDIVTDWDKAANRSSEDPVTKVLTPDIDKTVLEVLTTAGVLQGSFEFSGGGGPKTITNAQLIAALGSETDFKLRAWFVRSGLRSLNHDEVTVRKI